MENAAYESVIGNQAMPYLNETIVPGALSLSHMQANAHPSLPNYVWMAAGTACGASDDDDWGVTCPSVYDQLLDARIGWRVYAEGYPGGAASCDRAASSDTLSNDYARKHVPPLLFARTSSGAACTAHVVDFPHDTPADASPPVANFGHVVLPAFTVVIPNLCHDGHNDADECGAAHGGDAGEDEWLRLNWADLLHAAGPDGVVILTWDEGDGDAQRIVTLIDGQRLGRAGEQDAGTFDHASTLRAIQDAFGLPCLAASCDAEPLPIRLDRAP
jgi:hypothetical protein